MTDNLEGCTLRFCYVKDPALEKMNAQFIIAIFLKNASINGHLNSQYVNLQRISKIAWYSISIYLNVSLISG